MYAPHKSRLGLLPVVCLWQLLAWSAAAVTFDPCSTIEPIDRGSPIVVGLVHWPGALLSDWGSPDAYLDPCNSMVQANLTASGAMFSTYNIKADRLTVLKTSFPEELFLTSRAPSAAPKVITMMAFRSDVRSEPRYIVSFEPSITSGTGFVSSLSLIAKLEAGKLKYLQWYNLTCNDCGGRTSTRCVNSTSCALSWQECTCPSMSTSGPSSSSSSPSPTPEPEPSPSPSPALGVPEVTLSSCSYANYSFCATGVTMSFEGTDLKSAAFSTAGQVKKLNSYSLVSLYFVAKTTFGNVKDLFTDTTGEYWGKFGVLQSDINQAYSGNAAANVDAASSGMIGR